MRKMPYIYKYRVQIITYDPTGDLKFVDDELQHFLCNIINYSVTPKNSEQSCKVAPAARSPCERVWRHL